MISRSSNGIGPAAELTIDVPHWLASVSVLDNNLQPVDLPSRIMQVPGDPFLGRLSLTLEPGPYQVSVTMDGKTQSQWVVAEPGASSMLTAHSWHELRFDTALPLPNTAPVTHPNDQLARIASINRPRRSGGGDSLLSLFGTAIIPESQGVATTEDGAPRDFDFDMAILRPDGSEVLHLGDASVRRYVAQHALWRCFLDMDTGPYVLRARVPTPRSRPDAPARYRHQPLFLCRGMDHALYFRCDGPADLSTLTMHVTFAGQGYDPLRPEAMAADALLTALANGQAQRLLLGSETLSQLLQGEFGNPWLGVLAAYGLMAGPITDPIQDLIDQIVRYLASGPLADHPDVQILMINDWAEPAPLVNPPMLLAAMRRLQRLAMTRTGLIAPQSPLEAVSRRLIADTAWTAWIETVETRPQAAGDAAPVTSRMPPPLPAFVEAFPENAPVYPLQQVEALPAEVAIQENATLAGHAAIIAAASQAIEHVAALGIGAVKVRFNERIGSLLDLTAEDVSRLTGAPLDQAIRYLTLLGTTQTSTADPMTLERPMQLLAAAILGRQISASAQEGKTEGPMPPTPIETQARRLTEEIARLRRLKLASDPDTALRLEALAALFEACAARLIKRAHLVILADEKGRLRYGNKLFRDRLDVREEGADAVLRRMEQVFSQQSDDIVSINAALLSPTSPEGRAETLVEVQRVALSDGQQSIGFIYFIRDQSFPPIDRETAQQVDDVLPLITLSSSMLQFAQPEEQTNYLIELEGTARQLCDLLSVESAVDNLGTVAVGNLAQNRQESMI